jgi:bifunctional non-homologous end joining protein LigD
VDLPYVDRRRVLEDLVEPAANWAIPSNHVGGGAELLEATRAQGLEGVIAKHMDSPYRPGTRTKDWRKIKNRVRTSVTIGGFTTGTGNRSSTFGALLVGRRAADGRLEFAGGVGTGFDQRTLETLTARLRALAVDTCPFDPLPPSAVRRTATWVDPILVADLEIAEYTNDGLVRHASFVSLTNDRCSNVPTPKHSTASTRSRHGATSSSSPILTSSTSTATPSVGRRNARSRRCATSSSGSGRATSSSPGGTTTGCT